MQLKCTFIQLQRHASQMPLTVTQISDDLEQFLVSCLSKLVLSIDFEIHREFEHPMMEMDILSLGRGALFQLSIPKI